MCLFWKGAALALEARHWNELAIFQPLLEKMDIHGIIDRHLPPDPQLEYSHGQVLTLLLAARLQNPVALMNVAAWARDSGAEIFYDVPAEKLNDDRLGRALDAFFTQRHAILASVAEHVVRTFELPTERLHYDPTHLLFEGVYDQAKPISKELPMPSETPSADFPPAHITHGYRDKRKMIQVGLLAVVDDLGAVPIYGHTLSGNRNGVTAIEQQVHLLEQDLQPLLPPPPVSVLMVSDRGTFSAEHVARLQRANQTVLCSVSWADYRPLFEQERNRLHWHPASFLSVEQQRRRECDSTLPKEHYKLAVHKHRLVDPQTQKEIPCRVIFVFSSAREKAQKDNRATAIAAIRQGLEALQNAIARGHSTTKLDKIPGRVAKLFGNKEAARYFRWELLLLTKAERTALPPPPRGGRLPTHRFVFSFDEAAVAEDDRSDGYYALLTTASITFSADTLFTYFRQQIDLESAHHQWKTPLAVCPLFLKNPSRVEALVHLMQIALTAYHLPQRLYRQAVAQNPDLGRAEKRLTTESILRAFRICPLGLESVAVGKLVHVSSLTPRQREILARLKFRTPMQAFAQRLPKPPPFE